MPMYDYECENCKEKLEIMQNMSDDAQTICPKCSKPTLKKVIKSFNALHFKGAGFYVNDSKK